MIRIYDDRGFVLRNWLSMAILVGATIWGVVEIVRYQTGVSDNTGLLFGVGFLAASAYGGYRMFSDARDAIVRIEADFDSGQSAVTLWRPWGLHRLAAPLAALSGWRMYVAVKTRNQQTYLLQVNHADNPRPLHIELKPNVTPLDALRPLAPEAIEEFETRIGRRSAT